MMSTNKESFVTGPEVSEPQGPAGVGGIVPAPSPSSSDVGLPLVSQESTRGEATISSSRFFGTLAVCVGPRCDAGSSGLVSASKGECPASPQPGPSREEAPARDAEFKRPGPVSSKKKKTKATPSEPSEEDSYDGGSESNMDVSEDMSGFSDFSSDTNYALSHGGAVRPPGRPPTTGEHVGSRALKARIKLLQKELEKVKVERDVLEGRFDTTFGVTAGGVPASDDMKRQFTDETVDSLVNMLLEDMGAVEHVAERSGSLKGTFQKRLRASSRRAVAVSKLLFERATACAESNKEAGALDQARREAQVARRMIDESQNRVRELEEEVKVLRAEKTLNWTSGAGRSSPPPRHRTPTFLSDSGGEHCMEVEDSPGVIPPPRADPPPRSGSPPSAEVPMIGPSTSLELFEGVVERLLGKLLPPMLEALAPRPAPTWSGVVKQGAKRNVAPAAPTEKVASSAPSLPTQGEKGKKRKKKKKKRKKDPAKDPAMDPAGGRRPPTKGVAVKSKKPQPEKKKRTTPGVVKEPRTQAVMLSVAPGYETTMAEVLKKTRLAAAGVTGTSSVRIKKAQCGGTLLQFPGEEGRRIADEVFASAKCIEGDTPGARVTRPMKRVELRLRGLDDSVTKEEIIDAVTGMAGCRAEDLTVGEVSRRPDRVGSVWLRCPVAVSNKILEGGLPRIGWAKPTATPLPARRMRCYRCLEVGHGVALCKGVDRSGRCHRCGDRSHFTKACEAVRPNCPLCSDLGLPALHSLGGGSIETCVSSARAAQRKRARLNAGKIRKAKEVAPPRPPDKTGEGSRGGPCGAEPPETLTPAGPAGGKGKTPRGRSSSLPKKGTRDTGGGGTAPAPPKPPDNGEGSRGGPCGAEPPETLTPAGPTGGKGKTSDGHPSSLPEKGTTDTGGGRVTRLSLKRSASVARTASAQRGQESAGKREKESPPLEPAPKKNLRDRGERPGTSS